MYDLISRQMAIDAMKDALDPHIVQFVKAKMAIEALPAAQSEPTQEIQDILDYLNTVLHPIVSPEHWDVYSRLHDMVSSLPSAQPKYEPVTAEDFAKVMSESTIYGFMAWHGEALALMKRMGFVICKKT